jgi:hypothetical protein
MDLEWQLGLGGRSLGPAAVFWRGVGARRLGARTVWLGPPTGTLALIFCHEFYFLEIFFPFSLATARFTG